MVFAKLKGFIMTMQVTENEVFDNIVLNGIENALDSYFIDGNIVKFEDGSVFKTKEELRNYYNDRDEYVQSIIEQLKPDDFNIQHT